MSETATQLVGQNPLQYVSDQLAELRAKGTAPKLRVVEGEQKPVCVIDGREAIKSDDQGFQAQGCGGLRAHPAGERELERAQADHHRRSFLDGRRYRAAAGALRPGGKI